MKLGAAEQSGVSLSLNRHVVCLPACCAACICKWPCDNMSSHWTQVRDVSEREDQKWPEGFFVFFRFFVFSVWVRFIICPHSLGNNLGMTMKEVFWCAICLIFSTWRNRVLELRGAGKLQNIRHISAAKVEPTNSHFVITGWRKTKMWFCCSVVPYWFFQPTWPQCCPHWLKMKASDLSLFVVVDVENADKVVNNQTVVLCTNFFFIGRLFCCWKDLFWRDQTITEHFRACMGTTVCSLCCNRQYQLEGLQSNTWKRKRHTIHFEYLGGILNLKY